MQRRAWQREKLVLRCNVDAAAMEAAYSKGGTAMFRKNALTLSVAAAALIASCLAAAADPVTVTRNGVAVKVKCTTTRERQCDVDKDGHTTNCHWVNATNCEEIGK